MFTISLMLINDDGMQVNKNISSFLVSVLFKTMTIEIKKDGSLLY